MGQFMVVIILKLIIYCWLFLYHNFWSKVNDLFLQEMAKIKTETSSGQSQRDYDQAKLGEWIFVLMVYIQVYDIC
jgi:hypothetical protein